MEQVVVVGASLAGLRAVEGLRRRGYAGGLTLIGEDPHPPYDRPPLSKQVLAGAWEPERTRFRQKDGYDGLELTMHLGTRAVGLDPSARRVRLQGGDDVGYDRLLIATGAAARRLPGSEGLSGVHVLRTLDDAIALRADLQRASRVAIVGAGFIGLEVAACCRGMDLPVTVVDPLPLPLSPVLGSQLATAVCDIHRAEGVELVTGVGVDGIGPVRGSDIESPGGGSGIELRLTDGRALQADVVVVGIGVRPCTDWLRDSGVELDPKDGAVLTGSDCQSSVAGVYAAGDVARFMHAGLQRAMRVEHWTHAVEMANAAVEHMLDPAGATPFSPVPYVWSDQYGVKLQFAGAFSSDDALQIVSGSAAERKLVGAYHRDGRLTGVVAFSSPVGLIKGRRLLAEGAALGQALETLAG